MTYFKINNTDFSMYVNALKIGTSAKYSAQTNAAGDTVADFINSKRTITVGIIPLDNSAMAALQAAISGFGVSLAFLNPETNALEENIACIIPSNDVEYYTIQVGKVSFKAFTLTFTEL